MNFLQFASAAQGFYFGFSHVICQNATQKDDKNYRFEHSYIRSTWRETITLLKLDKLSRHFEVLSLYKKHILIGGIALAVTNFRTYYSICRLPHKFTFMSSNSKDRLNQLCCKIWTMTPYLLSITQVALFALEYNVNPIKGAAGLCAMGIAMALVQIKSNESKLARKTLLYTSATLAFIGSGPLGMTIIGVETVSRHFFNF